MKKYTSCQANISGIDCFYIADEVDQRIAELEACVDGLVKQIKIDKAHIEHQESTRVSDEDVEELIQYYWENNIQYKTWGKEGMAASYKEDAVRLEAILAKRKKEQTDD